jgi:hypothetical protein
MNTGQNARRSQLRVLPELTALMYSVQTAASYTLLVFVGKHVTNVEVLMSGALNINVKIEVTGQINRPPARISSGSVHEVLRVKR